MLIVFSSIFNYSIGLWFNRYRQFQKRVPKWILIFGIGSNLALLCYFKYFNFFIENLNNLSNLSIALQNIILPIGISFYTFIQIVYLVDNYKGKVGKYTFLEYCFFVTFFPHLLAGPLIHHQELIPQLNKEKFCSFNFSNISVGLTIFFIGLFKKVVLADGVSVYANAVFKVASKGVQLTFFESWVGALAYSFQLYFDFSGYSDMAIGLARIFNIWFPVNFYSPYKASSVIEFWYRWHITLSRFFRDYLYIPLGGNRKGSVRRYVNLLVTMLFVGLWHGAGWTFILWGWLHGIFLVINHLWRWFLRNYRIEYKKLPNQVFYWASRLITFITVVFAWVVFRAKDMNEAFVIWKSMVGFSGIDAYAAKLFPHINLFTVHGTYTIFFILASLLFICWFFPNLHEVMSNFKPALRYDIKFNNVPSMVPLKWKPNFIWLVLIFIMATFTFGLMDDVKEFLYYQF
ncbi:MAG: MBOAT family protein [Prolixibacteraceae bacterium]|nr:MBOAT family protein [Prolixibacteraceae bacterium]